MFKRRKRKLEQQSMIVVDNPSYALQKEGYTRLKDNLLFMNIDGTKKVIQIESSVQHEGKTTVLCNLAVSLGITNKKVVVVDIDFRRPRAHRMFKKSKAMGVSDYILGEATLQEVIKPTGYQNVDIVTCGETTSNPTLIFISEKFKQFINELKAKYDFVLLDCAPVLQVSDFIHISKVSDGVLFVVAYGLISKVSVADAVKELKKNDIDILGSIFSMYDRKKDKAYGFGGGYYKNYSRYKSYVEEDTDKE